MFFYLPYLSNRSLRPCTRLHKLLQEMPSSDLSAKPYSGLIASSRRLSHCSMSLLPCISLDYDILLLLLSLIFWFPFTCFHHMSRFSGSKHANSIHPRFSTYSDAALVFAAHTPCTFSPFAHFDSSLGMTDTVALRPIRQSTFSRAPVPTYWSVCTRIPGPCVFVL